MKNAREFYELVSSIESELGGYPVINDIAGNNQSIIDFIVDNNNFVELDRNFNEDGLDYYSHIRVCLNNCYYHCEFSADGIKCYVHQLEEADYYKKIIHSEICTYNKFLSKLYRFLDIYGRIQN